MSSEAGDVVFQQEFRWDARGAGSYRFGDEGCLVMDGSVGIVRCSRPLRRSITDASSAVDLTLRVTLDRPYHVRFYHGDALALDCRLARSGWIEVVREGRSASTNRYLTLNRVPAADPALFDRLWYAKESDEIRLRFGAFDLDQGAFELRVTGPCQDETVRVADGLQNRVAAVDRIELATEEPEPGARMRLRRYGQTAGGRVVDEEDFACPWTPFPPPPDGYPRDNVCETTLRPIGYRWLETSSYYGFVTTPLPTTPEGELTCEVKTASVVTESCLALQEMAGLRGDRFACPVTVGIMHERF